MDTITMILSSATIKFLLRLCLRNIYLIWCSVYGSYNVLHVFPGTYHQCPFFSSWPTNFYSYYVPGYKSCLLYNIAYIHLNCVSQSTRKATDRLGLSQFNVINTLFYKLNVHFFYFHALQHIEQLDSSVLKMNQLWTLCWTLSELLQLEEGDMSTSCIVEKPNFSSSSMYGYGTVWRKLHRFNTSASWIAKIFFLGNYCKEIIAFSLFCRNIKVISKKIILLEQGKFNLVFSFTCIFFAYGI